MGTTLILLAFLGIYIANRTYQHEVIVEGVLGLAFLYLQFYYIKHSRIDASMDTMLADPKKQKYLLYAFAGPGIAYWAIGGFLDMVSAVVKSWP
jgi:hypothetical protein